MKKKLVALVALAAMVLSMLPVAAFADETTTPTTPKINIYVTGYNNDMSRDEISVSITGDDLEVGMLVYWLVNGVDQPQYLGKITRTGESQNNFYIKKADIPGIEDGVNRPLTISVSDADFENFIISKEVDKDIQPVAPSSMKINVDTKGGTSNRTFTVTFDDEYVMGANDELAYQQFDKDGDPVPGTNTKYVDITSVKDGKFTFTKSFDEDTASVKFTFERNGVADKDLTATVKLESPYGEFKELMLDFGTTVIKQGETLTGKLYYVNTDGKRTDITDEADSYNVVTTDSDALESSNSPDTPTVTIADDATLGSKVNILAFYNNKPVNASLTVIDDAEPGKVKMNITSGSIVTEKEDQIGVAFTLLDNNGKTMKLSFRPTNVDIRWIDSSVSDPGFSVIATDGTTTLLQTKGVLNTALACKKPCTGKFEITFTDDKGHAYQVVSDTFTFKDPDAEPEGAQKVVVTIGSTTMQVDGKNKTIIAPPIIDNGRTYVPLRAISEAFGATVDWKQATNLITIDRGDTHIVMTPYKLAYTLNGQEKMMDVAPYISTAYASTMVPVRFIADAFGFDSIPEYNADNTTRAVTFTVK